ncbi:MAG: ABC transporter ATP-binding protein [Xanthobacteraceae bacterium]
MVVEELDLALTAGTTHCLVGESGCGKSLTCLTLMGLLPAGARRVAGLEVDGVVQPARRRGPAPAAADLSGRDRLARPLMTVGQQIAECAARRRRARRREAEELIAQVGIAKPRERYDSYPHEFSGGMNQRIAIAMALAGRPKALLADEPTTALDVTIQAQILDLLLDLQAETGLALLFVTHDLGIVMQIGDSVSVMYCGRIVEHGLASELLIRPQHPYTRDLMACRPTLIDADRRLASIPGSVPPIGARPASCSFEPRCRRAIERCRTDRPDLRGGHRGDAVACFNPL